MAVLGGNDPHSYGVTSRRASMNTLGPKIGGDGWIRTTALFKGQIYSLVQSTTLPRLQKRVRARLQSLVSHYWEKCSGDMPLQNGTRYGNRTRLTYVKGMCPKPIDEPCILYENTLRILYQTETIQHGLSR